MFYLWKVRIIVNHFFVYLGIVSAIGPSEQNMEPIDPLSWPWDIPVDEPEVENLSLLAPEEFNLFNNFNERIPEEHPDPIEHSLEMTAMTALLIVMYIYITVYIRSM